MLVDDVVWLGWVMAAFVAAVGCCVWCDECHVIGCYDVLRHDLCVDVVLLFVLVCLTTSNVPRHNHLGLDSSIPPPSSGLSLPLTLFTWMFIIQGLGIGSQSFPNMDLFCESNVLSNATCCPYESLEQSSQTGVGCQRKT